jgi:multidrug resistance efflux pump
MNSIRKVVIINVVLVVVVIVAAITGYYFYNQSTLYLSTDDAQVTGDQIVVSAPAAGKLTDWNGKFGASFSSGSQVGTVETQQGARVVDVPVTMPAAGTIVQASAMNNEFVAPGTPLAYAYNINNLYVTANISETNISDVKVGQQVDVYVDAKSGSLTGTVSAIGLATANTFSLLPSQSTTADYTKVTQVIPVTISLPSTAGMGLVPGMSASVRIHK